MRRVIIGLFIVGAMAFVGSVMAAEETWKDGVLFVEEKIASVEGHTAFTIILVWSRVNAQTKSQPSVNGS